MAKNNDTSILHYFTGTVAGFLAALSLAFTAGLFVSDIYTKISKNEQNIEQNRAAIAAHTTALQYHGLEKKE